MNRHRFSNTNFHLKKIPHTHRVKHLNALKAQHYRHHYHTTQNDQLAIQHHQNQLSSKQTISML